MVLVGGAVGNGDDGDNCEDDDDDDDDDDEYATYSHHRSKIFIRLPKTLFATEDALEAKKPDIGEW